MGFPGTTGDGGPVIGWSVFDNRKPMGLKECHALGSITNPDLGGKIGVAQLGRSTPCSRKKG